MAMARQEEMKYILDKPIPFDIQRKLKKPMKPIELTKMLEVIELRRQRKIKKQEKPAKLKLRELFRESNYDFKDKISYATIPGAEITYTNLKKEHDEFIMKVDNDLKNEITHYITTLRSFKIIIIIEGKFLNISGNLTLIFSRSKPFEISRFTRITMMERIRSILERLMEKEEGESGLTFQYIESIKFIIVKSTQLKGSSFIETPKPILLKKAILNIQNKDDKCFLYCIAASDNHIDSRQHAYRPNKYDISVYNTTGISFPMKIEDIPKFEVLNSKAVNVYTVECENDKVTYFDKLYISNQSDLIPRIDLLLLNKEDEPNDLTTKRANNNALKNITNHYTLITHFNALCYNLIPNTHKLVRNNTFFHICRSCLTAFTTEIKYNNHIDFCKRGDKLIQLPPVGAKVSSMEYRESKYSVKHPIVIYADFESILEPVDIKQTDTSILNQHHTPSSFAIKIVTDVNFESKFILYRGIDIMTKFNECIKNIAEQYIELRSAYPDCPTLSEQDLIKYNNSTKCIICEKDLNGAKYKTKSKVVIKNYKVKHHNHFTGEFIGAAHTICNLACSNPTFIPVIFHNLSRYDSHFIMQEINSLDDGEITLIPKTEEEYIAFSKTYKFLDDNKVEMRFMDSYRFLPESLDTLATNLLDSGKEKFVNLLNGLSDVQKDIVFWEETKQLITNKTIIDEYHKVKMEVVTTTTKKQKLKGIFPYDYVDSFKKYDEKELPDFRNFKNKMKNEDISEEEKEQVKKVWNSIPDCTIGAYSDLYLKTDVLILADVFEAFRDLSVKIYSLDPVNFYTTPSLAWQAMLQKTGIELDLITDKTMYLMIENGIRGGISQVCGDRYVDVSDKNFITNPEINESDPNQEWLLYVDANNLYGHSMSQKLPYGNFEWMSGNDLEEFKRGVISKTLDEDGDEGYIFLVDITNVGDKEKFKNLPLISEKKAVGNEYLSNYTKNLYTTDNKLNRVPNEKLISDFKPKKNYTIHYKNLIYCLRQGLEITIKRGIKFSQSNWLQPYIDFNTNLRAQAKNEFEKNFFKLMNNAVYGKTMENVRNRIDLKLVKTYEQAKKYIKRPNFTYLKRFSENLCAIHLEKTKVYLNKPIYVGFSVLELSKLHMYKFYYDKLKPKFESGISILYCDTDAFVLHIKTGNL